MSIITLTINPALDKSAKINGLVPEQKLRCFSINHQPGGGGVNISRVLKRLGTESNCMVALGGETGNLFENLLLKEGVKLTKLPIASSTRENFSVVDTQTSLQYRFGMPSNKILSDELEAIKKILQKKVKNNDVLVLSGSLPELVSENFYSEIITLFEHTKVKIVLDTSGKPLEETLKDKAVFLVKPNQRELAQLANKEFLSTKEQEAFAMSMIESKKAEYIVVSLGARGAFMASKEGIIYQTTPSVKVNSTIGAGDSMVAGLLYALEHGFSNKHVLKYGVACGVATTMSEGTNLASIENIEHALELIN